ncbi:L-tyrosine/L-tryptophan isonitrile synthase family protein [Kitasatospora cathayae]|uniref:L-tyrosine/L-tryptophan isonitrile synthase family protein n=1 Tax=Kitasatospora cathayae TaxID=3004092 RepID=UPI0038602177
MADFIDAGEPIVFTLPGFPCKSPNPAKVLGHLPDEGERLSLTFLDELCVRIGRIHPPGARILICSNGHIFGDLINVPDDHIDEYSDELTAMIEREGLHHLDTFDLRAVLGDLPYDDKRARVHERYAPSAEELRVDVEVGAGAEQLLLGDGLVTEHRHLGALFGQCRRQGALAGREARADHPVARAELEQHLQAHRVAGDDPGRGLGDGRLLAHAVGDRHGVAPGRSGLGGDGDTAPATASAGRGEQSDGGRDAADDARAHENSPGR